MSSTTPLADYFDRVVVISLKRRPDRLAMFRQDPGAWPFRQPDVFEAIDGRAVAPPVTFRGGPGAWGCLLSHRTVLERAIADNVRHLLVMEDDCVPRPDFTARAEMFLRNVPDDWDQLMLGGDHRWGMQRRGVEVRPGIIRCIGCILLHCYAVRGQFMRDLHAHWSSPEGSNGDCDQTLADIQPGYHVYAPFRFLAFQRIGARSDIRATAPAKITPSMAVHVEKTAQGSFLRPPAGGVQGSAEWTEAHDVTLDRWAIEAGVPTREERERRNNIPRLIVRYAAPKAKRHHKPKNHIARPVPAKRLPARGQQG